MAKNGVAYGRGIGQPIINIWQAACVYLALPALAQ